MKHSLSEYEADALRLQCYYIATLTREANITRCKPNITEKSTSALQICFFWRELTKKMPALFNTFTMPQ